MTVYYNESRQILMLFRCFIVTATFARFLSLSLIGFIYIDTLSFQPSTYQILNSRTYFYTHKQSHELLQPRERRRLVRLIYAE